MRPCWSQPLVDGREWWRGHVATEPENTSTYAVSEVMVRPRWRKQGISGQVHEALLGACSEALAVLYVDTEHPRVQTLYETWNYRKVGEHRPFEDAPLYAVMVRQLAAANHG